MHTIATVYIKINVALTKVPEVVEERADARTVLIHKEQNRHTLAQTITEIPYRANTSTTRRELQERVYSTSINTSKLVL